MSSKPEVIKEFPSEFGSHSVMIDAEKTTELNSETKVICKDQFGFYETDKWRLDNNLSDPNRWRGSRVDSKKSK